MSANFNCACGAAPTLIFACSGSSDVGEIADRAARRFMHHGAGRMYCLAGAGGRMRLCMSRLQRQMGGVFIAGRPQW